MTPQFTQTNQAAAHPAELLVVFSADYAPKTPGVANVADAKASVEPKILNADDALVAATKPLLSSGEYKAAANELVLLHAPAGVAAKRILLAGLGKHTGADLHALRKAAGAAVRYAKARNLREITLLLPESVGDAAAGARAVAEGAVIADFDGDTYRSYRKDTSLLSLTLLGADPAAEQGMHEGTIVAEAQNFARTLVNEPGNVLTPTELGKRAAAMCAEIGVPCEVFSTEKLRELGMGAFLGVAQGSYEPPALIVARYEPEGAPADVTLGLVGKAITFDTGGISIKPADGMDKMKYDMAGGAAMLGALKAIAELKLKVRVLAVICSAENMPSGRAYRPGDVLTAMSGKTIEVINTDAEGRLVLADGLHYAKQLGATHLIDAATLTGAVGVALGKHNAGVFANDEASLAKFTAGLGRSGEHFWRLPLGEEYLEQIRSDIGDLMNTGGRYGGASTAAQFLGEFAGDTPWLHLDIASMAWLDDGKAWIARGPSGVAVRSILEWAREFSA
jgi:leucyl aminopeptidase